MHSVSYHLRSWLPALLACGALSAHAQLPLQADFGLWSATPDGTLSIGAAGTGGTKVDLQDDLGFENDEQVWSSGLIIGETHQLALSYLAFEASAQNTVESVIEFGGFSYVAEATLATRLEGQLIGVAYRYAGGDPVFRSGFLAGVEWASLEAEAAASFIGRGKGEASSPIPVVGAFAGWRPAQYFLLGGSVKGGAWNWKETSVSLLDAEASARLIFEPFVMGVGYRHLAVSGDDSDIPAKFDLSFSGPVWFAGLSF